MSYHDLHITTKDIDRASISNLRFGLVVRCCRVSGWELWDESGVTPTLIAGEYNDSWLKLDVDGVVIVDIAGDSHNA